MILKTDVLTTNDILGAVPEGCYIIDITPSRTKMREYAFVVRLGGSSKYAPRRRPGHKAASYDEWGWFLAALYDLDENMICSSVYYDRNDFEEKTQGAYA